MTITIPPGDNTMHAAASPVTFSVPTPENNVPIVAPDHLSDQFWPVVREEMKHIAALHLGSADGKLRDRTFRLQLLAHLLNPETAPAPASARNEEPAGPHQQHRGQVRIAHRLAREHAGELLHVKGIGWHHWDGKRWADDSNGYATRAVLATLKSALGRSLHDPDLRTDVRKCESASGIKGVLEIASALPEFAATVQDMDANPYLFNVANGTLDLHSLALRPHDPADRITKVTTAAFNPSTPGTAWETFLHRTLPDEDVRGFLQRYVGLSLAGIVLEHVLAILTGTGRNGKGVFYGAISSALGDYAMTAEPNLFLHKDNAHPTGQMDLKGVRWVVVSENDKNSRFAEATVKHLTGGDKIKARRMRQDFVQFDPSHTAALVTNHLPKVSADDPAIWERLRVVPFDVVIPEAERNVHLPEQLQLEADAILTWIVTGWAEYQRQGLSQPPAVVVATSKYQASADDLGRFIEERCDTGYGLSTTTEILHTAWNGWAALEKVPPVGKNVFAGMLEARGYTAKKGTGGTRARQGIALRTEPLGPAPSPFAARGT